MRNAFVQEIQTIAAADERTVLLSGDIGNRMFDRFKAAYPNRFYNCGIAEANMMGMASGLALSGMRPITYTIAAFNTLRCLEQIRVDVCFHNLPVVIVGVGSGLSYAGLNATHHALEDIACLRALPNMTVLCPADSWETRGAIHAAMKHDGPVYIRIGKKNEPTVHHSLPNFQIGKGIVVREGQDICILNSGTLLPTALETADALEALGVSTHVVSMHTIKPLDVELLSDVFEQFSHVFTLEEHSIVGGFGSSVAEWASENSTVDTEFLRLGTSDSFMLESGNQDEAREFFKIDTKHLVTTITKAMGGPNQVSGTTHDPIRLISNL